MPLLVWPIPGSRTVILISSVTMNASFIIVVAFQNGLRLNLEEPINIGELHFRIDGCVEADENSLDPLLRFKTVSG